MVRVKCFSVVFSILKSLKPFCGECGRYSYSENSRAMFNPDPVTRVGSYRKKICFLVILVGCLRRLKGQQDCPWHPCIYSLGWCVEKASTLEQFTSRNRCHIHRYQTCGLSAVKTMADQRIKSCYPQTYAARSVGGLFCFVVFCTSRAGADDRREGVGGNALRCYASCVSFGCSSHIFHRCANSAREGNRHTERSRAPENMSRHSTPQTQAIQREV